MTNTHKNCVTLSGNIKNNNKKMKNMYARMSPNSFCY